VTEAAIGLPGLNGGCQAPVSVSAAPSTSCTAALDQFAKKWLTVSTAHIRHLLALEIGRLQAKLKMSPKNTFDSLEFCFTQES
jgi:hypothetical protein